MPCMLAGTHLFITVSGSIIDMDWASLACISVIMASFKARTSGRPRKLLASSGVQSTSILIFMAASAYVHLAPPRSHRHLIRIRSISLSNHLAKETSPYLLQHKDNPVDWHAWGPDALSLAKAENKPILLSVGYAACHWCHVMAHESFENPEVAALMNELFVCIKVDREERPDLDSIYQMALAVTGQQGGWPLTMFLSPDGKPFAGGTYFPPERRYGRPGFPDVLKHMARIWRDEPERVARAEGEIMKHLGPALNPSAPPAELSIEFLDQAAAQIVRMVDPHSGGLGEAPKFPQTPLLELLWRAYLRTGEAVYRTAVENTLTHMCQGGIYDHLGGGFARYSVDAEWLVPHFEKMLYDNAQLISLLTLVWQSTKFPLFKQRVEETVEWVLREMRSPEGGLYSSLDADSEGHEGKFYVWSKAEIEEILGIEDARLFCSVYGVSEDGNFEGANILNRLGSLELLDEAHEMRLAAYRGKLLARRTHRVRPGLDDKILADWNGLMTSALARAGAAFARPDWLGAAVESASFLIGYLIKKDDLYHSWRGRPGNSAMAEDFANQAAAMITLYETTGEWRFLNLALNLSSAVQKRFSTERGGYTQAEREAADIIAPSRTIWDNATPPANATMLANHARLYAMTGEETHNAGALGILSAFSGAALKSPAGAASFLNSLELLIAPVTVGLAGVSMDDALAEAAGQAGNPNLIVGWAETLDGVPEGHPLHGKTAVDGEPTAYVCRGQVCSLPVTTPDELAALLQPEGLRSES